MPTSLPVRIVPDTRLPSPEFGLTVLMAMPLVALILALAAASLQASSPNGFGCALAEYSRTMM
jgi:hypothetical protein